VLHLTHIGLLMDATFAARLIFEMLDGIRAYPDLVESEGIPFLCVL
jgi:hypothetical protein